jgi:peptidoglycan L-alanyl-D-glutamate endopeptidase CwlK
LLAIALILLGILLALAWVGLRFFVKLPSRLTPSSEGVAVQTVGINATKIHKNEIQQKNTLENNYLEKEKQAKHGETLRTIQWPLFALGTVVAVVMGIMHFNSLHVLAPFLPKEYSQVDHIQDTLTESKLEPPAPLPPDVFIQANSLRPGIATANRDWDKLNPDFVQQVLTVMKKMGERGYPMVLLEGYRSPERQDELANLATLVTKAKGGQSKHQYGFAVDLAPMKNGKVVISEKDSWAGEAYQALGEEAEAIGLIWGGRWSFKDYGHIEISRSLATLKQAGK